MMTTHSLPADAGALEDPYGFTGTALQHGVWAGRLRDGAARSGDYGGHGMLVRPDRRAHGLPQSAGRRKRPRPGGWLLW